MTMKANAFRNARTFRNVIVCRRPGGMRVRKCRTMHVSATKNVDATFHDTAVSSNSSVAATSNDSTRSSRESTMFPILFDGISKLYSRRALRILENSVVAVIGLGGVGSWCCEALARSGIGTLVIADLDEVCVSNTNRQLHATRHTYGKSKAYTMAERLRDVNPEINVRIFNDFVTEGNVREFLEANIDIDCVIDCVDNERHKAAIIANSLVKEVPVIITVGGCGGKLSPRNIEVDDLKYTKGDKLLAKVRLRLRSDYNLDGNEKSTLLLSDEDTINSNKPNRGSIVETNVASASKKNQSGDVIAIYSHHDSDSVTSFGKEQRRRRGNMGCGNEAGSAVFVTGTFGFFCGERGCELDIDWEIQT